MAAANTNTRDLCPASAACMVAQNTPLAGRYVLHVPASWDGHSPLPAVMFFHGYRSTGTEILQDVDMQAFSNSKGVLLILPDGLDGSWSVTGGPRQTRDEFGFVHAVLQDVAKRLPLDKTKLAASGFSLGASMVWDLACFRGDEFAGYLPFSGSFWVPLPPRCPSGSVVMRHVHGVNDHTMPLVGRGIAKLYRQGDVMAGFSLWQKTNGCGLLPEHITKDAALTCLHYDHCSSHKALELCLHDGEHEMKAEWLAEGWDWLMRAIKPR